MFHPGMSRWSSVAAANFRETSNGRFDALLHDDNKLTSVVEAMCELAALQQAVGRRNVPLLVVWGVDVATTAQLRELTAVTAAFLATVRPEMLMLTGRRAPKVAFQAEVLLRRVLGAASGFKPKTLITGGADGIDAVALRLANDEPAASPGLKVTGEYTPTAFARADTPDHKINPKPVALRGLSPGRSPICDASAMVPRQHGDADFHEFLSLMEGLCGKQPADGSANSPSSPASALDQAQGRRQMFGLAGHTSLVFSYRQWEARDTANAQLAHACVAFLTHDPVKRGKGHDGTKATLNVFAAGRYAHPLPEGAANLWEAGAEGEARSPGVVELAGSPADGFVGYKLHNAPAAAQRHKAATLSPRGVAAAVMSAARCCVRRS